MAPTGRVLRFRRAITTAPIIESSTPSTPLSGSPVFDEAKDDQSDLESVSAAEDKDDDFLGQSNGDDRPAKKQKLSSKMPVLIID